MGASGGDAGHVRVHIQQIRPAALLMQRFFCPDMMFIRAPFDAREHLHQLDTLICRVRGNWLDGAGKVSAGISRRRGRGS